MVDFTWKIGGPAGFGIMSCGAIFSKAFSRGGYHVFDYAEFPSLIRGGHNTFQTRVADRRIFAQNRPVHVLVALNADTIARHKDELTESAVVIYDSERMKEEIPCTPCPVPLARLAKEAGGEELMANNVALGASIAVLDYELALLNGVIKDIFGRKGKAVVDANIRSAEAGYAYVKKHFGSFPVVARKLGEKRRLLIAGNEAMGAGAIAGGCKFYAGYPMTPTSSLLTYMATHAELFGVVVRQAEDEISVINNAIGAAHAGVRAMVGTAGGGFALMSEGYGLAAMTETPVVIIVGQRPGPATGLPTWTGQGDLRFVLHAHQDDFPRVVLAPGDAEDAFYMTAEAHNIAEKYQTPVIVLTDKYLAESHTTIDGLEKNIRIERGEIVTKPDTAYARYRLTPSGVSPRALPGTPGLVAVANSDEHVEDGTSTEESEERNAMMKKRMRKLDLIGQDLPRPKLYGKRDAAVTIVGFGSVKGPVLEALREVDANFLHFTTLAPFQDEAEAMLREAKKLLAVENNFTAQFTGLLREKTGVHIQERLLKYDGRPFYPEEIVAKVRSLQ